jgi:hypothetical protein
MKHICAVVLLLGLIGLLAGCSMIEQLFAPETPSEQREAPSLPTDLRGMLDTLGDLGLPDVSGLADLPGLESLPLLESIPGGIVYRGPVQRKVTAGNRVPGTDVLLVRTGDDGAEFEIGGLRSVRVVGDSLDFDGDWPEMPGVTYSARLRIYQVGSGQVRIAGVHQLGIPNIQPSVADSDLPSRGLKFPFTSRVTVGETIPGTTFGYAGVHERGAELSGLAAGEYPYRKVGDSIRWRGYLRPDIPVEYNVRALFFDDGAIQVGGVVSVMLPMSDGE